ncbi:MAG: hypothetical protein LBM38_02270 [Clostridiales bacterium]|jgi:hypothetical protein|nr:hypothetical protein [Clostridiales bacterium]
MRTSTLIKLHAIRNFAGPEFTDPNSPYNVNRYGNPDGAEYGLDGWAPEKPKKDAWDIAIEDSFKKRDDRPY